MPVFSTRGELGSLDATKRQTHWGRPRVGSTAVFFGAAFLALLTIASVLVLTTCTKDFWISLSHSTGNFWIWLTAEESGSATLRNVGLLLMALIGLPFAIWRTMVAARQTKIAQHSLRNERHQKAVEMLGNGVLPVRLGGIYALQQLAKEDAVNYHVQVMRIFCAFLHHPTTDQTTDVASNSLDTNIEHGRRDSKMYIRRDVQDVLHAIGSRDRKEIELEGRVGFDLVINGADYQGLKLYEVVRFSYDRSFKLLDSRPKRRAKFSNVHFRNVNFSEADLSFVDMSNAEFWDTDFTDAVLEDVDLSGTSWDGGSLRNARLSSVDLSRARIENSSFVDTDLSRADLSSVIFDNVDLSNANLSNANVSGTCFSLIKHNGALVTRVGAKEFGAMADEFYIGVRGLTQAQIDQAWASVTNPPQIEGVIDSVTGKPLEWQGKSSPS